MNRVIGRTKLIFLAIFAVLTAASWGYQFIWASPAKRCADHRGWWDAEHRICATPIDVSMFTHRPHGVKRTPQQKAADEAAAAAAIAKSTAAPGAAPAPAVAPAPVPK